MLSDSLIRNLSHLNIPSHRNYGLLTLSRRSYVLGLILSWNLNTKIWLSRFQKPWNRIRVILGMSSHRSNDLSAWLVCQVHILKHFGGSHTLIWHGNGRDGVVFEACEDRGIKISMYWSSQRLGPFKTQSMKNNGHPISQARRKCGGRLIFNLHPIFTNWE